MSEPLTGGCLCGEIRYAVDVAVTWLAACYCTDCQRRTSAAGSINAVVPASAFRITKGETRVFTKTADSGDATQVVLKAGTFNRHAGMRIALNLWTSSRPAWAPLDSSLPCHEKNIVQTGQD